MVDKYVAIPSRQELERRLELMWAWINDDYVSTPTGQIFLDEHPEAAGWFDEEGRVK